MVGRRGSAPRRLALGLAASTPSRTARSSTSSAAASSAAASTGPASGDTSTGDLTAALLPAEAFGADANVLTVDVRKLSTASGGLPPGASVTPAACANSMGATQLSVDDFGAIVAQSATSPADVTVQVLAESDKLDGLTPHFDDLLAQCSHITATAADGSTATVDFAAFDVPALGDSSDGVSVTTAVKGPDGTNVTVPSLLAVATDGHRLLYLQQTGTKAAPLDQAAFTGLFQDAFTTQQNH